MNQFDIEDVDSVRDRDMSAARKQKPKRTWFVRRITDGLVFACEEREAWDILYNTSTWKLGPWAFTFIGCSDGKTYQKVIAESIGEAKRLEPEIAQLEQEFKRYRAAEENLLVNEAVDMDDHDDPINEANIKKILRLRTIADKVDVKLEAAREAYRNVTRNVVNKATDAERVVAEENWKIKRTWPGRVNVMTPDASPEERKRILASMPGA